MPFDTQRVLRAIEALPLGEVRLMEVCGTHTMAIAKSGIRSLLPENVKLLGRQPLPPPRARREGRGRVFACRRGEARQRKPG